MITQCPSSVVHRASSVVRRQQFALNDVIFETARPRALIFGLKHCPNRSSTKFVQMVAPGSKLALGQGVLGFETKKILKNLLLHNCLAQMLEIWYVELPSRPLLSLFKWWPKGPKWPWGRGSWVRN